MIKTHHIRASLKLASGGQVQRAVLLDKKLDCHASLAMTEAGKIVKSSSQAQFIGRGDPELQNLRVKFLKTPINIWLATLLLVVMMLLIYTREAAADAGGYSDAFLKANHGDSLITYENYIQRLGVWEIDDCFSSGKVIWDNSELDDICLPGIISNSAAVSDQQCASTASATASGATGGSIGGTVGGGIVSAGVASSALGIGGTIAGALGGGVLAGGALAAASGGIGIVVVALVGGIQILTMMDVCTNAYVLQSWEYLNRFNDATCKVDNNFVVYDQSNSNHPILTADDVPFYYSCDPDYDPFTDSIISKDPSNPKAARLYGHTWGYMGSASQYCVPPNKNNARRDMIGKVVVEMLPGASKATKDFTICQGPTSDGGPVKSRYMAILKPGESKWAYVDFVAYYKYFESEGKIKICAAANRTMFPVRVGCAYVAPPGEDSDIDDFLKAYVSGTRCHYLIDNRTDLQSLGQAMMSNGTVASDDNGNDRTSVAKFLQSDFHFTSTVVGCIKDMLQKIFIKAPGGLSGPPPFFQVVQSRLKQIILSVLVLYVALVGIRIMSSPQPPQTAEVVMWLLKYGIVMYLALGDVLYSTDATGNVTGLYPQLLAVSDEIANMFLQAQNQYDLLGYCTYIKGGYNILSERMIDTSSFGTLTATEGYNGVKMTVWDMVDCKLVNYFNAGTCDYSVGGLMMAWITTLSILSPGNGLLLAISSFVYCFLLILVIFRFTHIFILAAIVITVLLFLAPIFVCFFLFEATKGIFDKWMKMILGYMLYPALLFAFLALMLATLDSIYYGPVYQYTSSWTNSTANPQVVGSNSQSPGTPLTITTFCNQTDSLYCDITKALGFGDNPCNKTTGATVSSTTETVEVGNTGVVLPRVNATFADIFTKHMLKLMLFTILFYLFIGQVAGFMAALLAVPELTMAGASFNMLSGVAAVGGLAKSGAGMLYNRLAKDK